MASVSATTSFWFKSSLKLSSNASQGSFCGMDQKVLPFIENLWFPHLLCVQKAQPETMKKVCEIVKKQLALPPDSKLAPENKFSALGADSLDTLEIVMALEEEFGINIEEDSSVNTTKVQEAVDLIEKLVQKKGAY